MQLDSLKRNWEAFGRDDPLWAVLTSPERAGGRWDLDEFLATGVQEVGSVLDELEALGLTVERRRALDFGCGVGRLTQALADRFDRCDGVDIAASMIDGARRINRHGERVSYHVNATSDLALFPDDSFDFVLSLLVLQHIEPRYAKRYIAEFIRVLKPGGVAVFQVPTGNWSQSPSRPPAGAFMASLALMVDWLADRGSRALRPTVDVHPASSGQPKRQDAPGPDADGRVPAVMEMHGIPAGDVRATVADAGGEVLHQLPDQRAGADTEGFRYIVRRVSEQAVPLPPIALSHLREAIAAVPDRSDMFPPLITRRSGRIGRLELRLREKLARVIRPVTWVQADYDRRVLDALNEARAALEQQDAELRRLGEELTRLRAR